MEKVAAPDAQGKLNYLTVQDILWINLQVTKKVQKFNYALLEEATYYQYGYGNSRSLTAQAARFLTGFLKMKPFNSGNEGTAFIGFAAFLLLNGLRLKLADGEGAAWLRRVVSGDLKIDAAVDELVEPEEEFHAHPNELIDEALREVMRRFPETVSQIGPA